MIRLAFALEMYIITDVNEGNIDHQMPGMQNRAFCRNSSLNPTSHVESFIFNT